MRFVEDLGVQVIGGCCGTRYDHIRELSEIGKTLKPKIREFTWEPSAASIYTAQPYEQENSFLIVGERLNASGSKKCRDLLNAEDWDGLVAMAREQVREGAHILDVNVDYVGRDGVRDMKELVSRVVTNATLPLMLDSTEWEKMEAGLKVAGGKCLLNSTNYEDGEPRFYQVLELAKKYGAGIVIGTIDEDGMARTADQKFAIAQRAYNAAVAYGIPAEEIFFDTLALPISTGIEEDRKNGKATIESIRRIRQELPGCHVILGVSNISFGLNPAARQVLNSMFLHEAMQAGMDSAIVSANKILPLAKIDPQHQEICRKLIYDEREFDGDICVYDPLGDLTTVFAGKTTKRDRTEDANLPVEERLKQHIIDGERIGLDIQLAKALETYPPLHIINTFLLDGMKVVGELFGSGQMQLPFVLQSAETMKAAVAYLEPHMEKSESGDNAKGTFIIATVKGDVHDIGKNLVDIILSNNGYRVINLGIKQSVDNIIEAYEKHKADCIAMSGLLVKSTAFMKENLAVFNQKGITVPVILGGAALTPKFVHEDCQNTYKGKVVYGKDAFSDLHFMDKLMPAKSAGKWEDLQGFLDEIGPDNGAVKEAKASPETSVEDAKKAETPVVIDTRRSEAVAADIDRPTPPFWGTKLLQPEDIPFEEIFWHLDLQALIAGQWQFRKPKDQSREEYDAFLAEKVYPILEEWKHKIITEKLLHPQAIYGYFPCQAEGNSLYLYHPEIMAGGQTIINGGQDARPTQESGTGILPVTATPGGQTIINGGQTIINGGQDARPTQESGTGILPVTATKESGTGILPVTATPAATFTFPRQKSGRRLCIADFFAPKESGKIDVFPMQVATVGEIATEYAQKLFANNQYSDYLYFHGLAVQTAEAVAEWTHARIRRELGFASEEPNNIRDMLAQRYRGSRYSFGYPACPNMTDQYKQLELLKCDRINLYMDESEQLYPEQSTTAIITYHPAAKYFTA